MPDLPPPPEADTQAASRGWLADAWRAQDEHDDAARDAAREDAR